MATKIKKNLLISIGLLAGAALLSMAVFIYNKLKKNTHVSDANVKDENIMASNIVYGNVVSGSITAQNQSITTVTAGTNGNNITLSALTIHNCTEIANRTITSIGIGITLKKNGVPLSVNSTFTAADTLTFDVASNVVANSAKEIFQYKASGVCGDSNIAIISANVIALSAASISVINQTINPANAGTTGIAVVLTTPTVANGCVFSGIRTLVSLAAGITLKKNGLVMLINTTWTNSDVITYDVANTVATTNLKELFRYRASGTCGNSNDAIISANITAVTSALSPFTFKDAWFNGSNYEAYASLVDAMDKNFEDVGFTNRTATLYTTSMDSDNIAYTNAGGTVPYPEGNYFDSTDFRYLSINAQGRMTLFGDAPKTGLNPINITEAH